MEVTFRTTKLRKCYESVKDAEREWGAEVARRYIQRVDTLYACKSKDDLYTIPSFKFHELSGDRRDEYAILLGYRSRLIVTFRDQVPQVVRVEGVSQHYGN